MIRRTDSSFISYLRTHMAASARLIYMVLAQLFIIASFAQAADDGGSGADNALGSNEVGIHAGPFLPNKIPGVTEVMLLGGLRGAIKNNFGFIEAEYFSGRGSGATYTSVSGSYRIDIPTYQPMVFHALMGLHFDFYTPRASTQSKVGGGWHFGGGTRQQLVGPFSMRADFSYHLSPGRSLYVSMGLMYQF